LLIIFDLDDTLIDTSGSITPRRLEKAFSCMQESGLFVENPAHALEELKECNNRSPSARSALEEFVKKYGGSQAALDVGLYELYDNPVLDMPIAPVPGALSILKELKKNHTLAIVSMGKPLLQREKMEKAGMDSTIFSKIAVCERDKKLYYQSVVKELGFLPKAVVVCGDKIEADLSPAKELGYTTIHFLFGRGFQSAQREGVVDYTITQLMEIKHIL